MSLFTAEELAAMPEGLRERVQGIASDYEVKTRQIGQIEDGVKKILSRPDTREGFSKMLKDAGVEGINIPDDPMRPYIEPLQKENAALKARLDERDKFDAQSALKIEMAKYGIPDEELDKLVEHQNKNKIGDNSFAVRTYAREREVASLESARFERPTLVPKAGDEKEAINATVRELMAAGFGGRR